MNIKFLYLFLLISLTFNSSILFSSENNIEYSKRDILLDISGKLLVLEDENDDFNIENITDKNFKSISSGVPNLGFSKSAFWVKISILNKSKEDNLLLELSLPILDYIEFYSPLKNKNYKVTKTGEIYNFNHRTYKDPHYLFDLYIPKDSLKTFYLKIKSTEGIQLPIKIGSFQALSEEIKNRDILSGIYFGLMLVMILYNLFVYLTVKDKSYIYYVIYIILILMTQTSLQGYPFQYLWPNTPIIAKYSLFIFPSLVGIASMVFMNSFLKVKKFNSFLYKLSYVFTLIYLVSILLGLIGSYVLSQVIMQANAMIVSLYMLLTIIYIVKKGFRPARYFLVAWSIFLLGVIAFILKDFEVLPFNNYTRYTMQIGSAIETVLLSFALAARINVYKKERLEAVLEKERLIREQNILLEAQVEERTLELEKTLENLKETQSQLVDAEKMSSLGQLTAGIAHEINNPINFVSSNISPLRQDIEDIEQIINKYEELKKTDNIEEKFNEIEALKKELDFDYLKKELPTIINGIEDGAKRTKEIVSGLRNFSRLDEVEFQMADINEGVESTLILLKSKLANINLIKKLAPLPSINCYPSKLNQLFMNVIDNAIGAIEEKGNDGEIIIETYTENNHIIFKISDNGIGIGIEDEILPKIFNPFFTTKDVGKGTGLGLSISRSIVDAHEGSINVESQKNIGTTLIIKIPNK